MLVKGATCVRKMCVFWNGRLLHNEWWHWVVICLKKNSQSWQGVCNSPFHEISASWHCLEFQPITGAAALQCGTVCCYRRQAAGDLKEMHWKVVAENEVVDVRSVFTRVNLTVGTIQKVVTEVQIRKMFTDLEVIRLYWPCHLFVSPACTAQFCTRCAVH